MTLISGRSALQRLPHAVASIGMLLTLATVAGAQSPSLVLRPERFQPRAAPGVDAEVGELRVPEHRSTHRSNHRSNDRERTLTLRFIRFRSRNPTPGPPIVYLAGGPGGSGIAAAAGSRWPIFDALRDVADVIALDQRGAGRSGSLPTCTTGTPVPDALPTTRDNLIRVVERQVSHCREFWSAQGVDLAAYSTLESAADLDALRAALGVPQLDLWGISYGTHLALATLKHFPRSVRRVVLVSPEGLDHTVKSPRATDAFFERVQASVNTDSAARARYPDIAAMIRRVLARVTASPVTVRVATGSDSTDIVMGAFELQRIAADRLADPSSTAAVLALFARADRGDWSGFGERAQRRTRQPIFFDPMPLGMDAASGVSPGRRAQVQREAATALLGDALGWPVLHWGNAMADLDLGESFRAPFRSDHRVMIVSGTLDGRTYPEEHVEVASSFRSPVVLRVEHGGHNTVLESAEVRARIKDFFSTGRASEEAVVMGAPRWVVP